MKVLIVSDTHHHNDNYFRVLERVTPIDLMIHCGDIEGSEYAFESSTGCPVEMVMGNNDFLTDLPKERELMIGKYKVLITHGHNYYVSVGNETLKREAKARGYDIVFYGHTHRPSVDLEGDIIAVNPGSLSYPRQEGKRPSYVIMELDRKGEAHFDIYYL